jgi:hypothetical protein
MNHSLVLALMASAVGFAGEFAATTPTGELVLWRAPRATTTSDWVWGPGGEERAPLAPFQFLKENLGGTNPKVEVRDARGRKWTVKFGAEVHTEVFASRLLYAVGYAAEPTYYVAEGVIDGANGLRRARLFIGKDGRFRNARFKLHDDRLHYADNYKWSWVESPFAGSQQLNGLRIMMMLLSNWDAKDARDAEGSNTAVFEERSTASPVYLYAMNDWGATLGSWGGFFKRDRWDIDAYERQTPHFVKGVKDGVIVWGYSGKHGEDITAGITRDDVRWLLPYLTVITDEQLRTGLLASGATHAYAERFTRAIRNRIAQLQQLAEPRQ